MQKRGELHAGELEYDDAALAFDFPQDTNIVAIGRELSVYDVGVFGKVFTDVSRRRKGAETEAKQQYVYD